MAKYFFFATLVEADHYLYKDNWFLKGVETEIPEEDYNYLNRSPYFTTRAGSVGATESVETAEAVETAESVETPKPRTKIKAE